MRRKALEAAEIELLDPATLTIPAGSWEQFEAWVAAPAKAIPGLQELSQSKPAWGK